MRLLPGIGSLLFIMLLGASARGQQTAAPADAADGVRPVRFVADPVTDGAILGVSTGVGALLDAIISTGELRPQQPGSSDNLLGIDRDVVDQRPNEDWVTVSNASLFGAFAYGAADSIFTAFDEGPTAGLVDAILYGESAAVTGALTGLAKLAVRRPRPSAYRARDEYFERFGTTEGFELSDTNSALSFFSAHASMTAALSTTATYLAFSRSRSPVRGFVTLGLGSVVTTMACVGRVKGGVHFPTDVIAGAMAGIGVGALVPHLHREGEPRPVWVGVGPQGEGGVGASLNGHF